VDLGVNKEVSAKGTIDLTIDCKDADGRPLHAEHSFKLGGKSPEEIALARKKD